MSLIVAAGINAFSPVAASQEFGFPNLRGHQLNIEYLSPGRMGIFMDTDKDNIPDVLYLYMILRNSRTTVFLSEPLGMYIDENNDNIFKSNEFYDFTNNGTNK